MFVTLRGGGLLVVDGIATPLRIVAEYTGLTVRGNGCGGMGAADRPFINAGAGTAGNPSEAGIYSFVLDQFSATAARPVGQPTPWLILSRDTGDHDSHGMTVTGGRFIWATDRFANQIEVVDAVTDTVVSTFVLPRGSEDPAPDSMVTSPDGAYVFMTFRGPCPQTGNTSSNNAVGNTPGIGVISVDDVGLPGRLVGIAPIVNAAPAGFDCQTRGDDAPGSITNQADPHSIGVRLK